MCGRRICEGSLGFLKTFSIYKKKKKGGGRQGASKSKHFRRQLFPLYSRKLAFPKTMEYKTG